MLPIREFSVCRKCHEFGAKRDSWSREVSWSSDAVCYLDKRNYNRHYGSYRFDYFIKFYKKLCPAACQHQEELWEKMSFKVLDVCKCCPCFKSYSVSFKKAPQFQCRIVLHGGSIYEQNGNLKTFVLASIPEHCSFKFEHLQLKKPYIKSLVQKLNLKEVLALCN